jgi:hypothetical protein
MATQNNNLMLLDIDPLSANYGLPRTIDTSNDDLVIGVDTSFGADLTVGGNLSVAGDIVSSGTMDVVVSDNFIDLSNGQATGTDKAGGMTVNVQSHIARVAASGMVFSGGNSFSLAGFDPSTGGVGGASLADGDIIEIAGCTDLAGNNGLFVVDSVVGGAGGAVTIKTTSQTQSPWAQTAFENGTESAAGATLSPALDLGIFCISDGALLDAGGNAIAVGLFVTAFAREAKLSNIAYESAQNVTLQEAYNAGEVIALSDAEGNLVIKTDDTGARADFRLANEVDSQTYLLTGAPAGQPTLKVGDGSNIRIGMSGQVTTDIVFDGVGPRAIQQTGQDITIETLTSGGLYLSAAADFDVQGVESSRVAMLANNANAEDLSIIAGNNGAGTANLFLSSTHTVETSAAGDISTLTSGGGIDSSAPAGAISHTAGLTFAASAAGQASLQSSAADVLVQAATSTVVSAQGGDLDLSASGETDIDGAGVKIDASAAGVQIHGQGAPSEFLSTGHPLTVKTATSGKILVESIGQVDIDAATDVDIDAQSGFAATTAAGDLDLAATSGAGTFLANTSLALTAGGLASLTSNTSNVQITATNGDVLSQSGANTSLTAGSAFIAQSQAGGAALQATGGNARVESTDANASLIGAVEATVRASAGDLSIQHQDAASQLLISTLGTGAVLGSEALRVLSAGAAFVSSADKMSVASSGGDVEVTAAAGQFDITGANTSTVSVSGAAQELRLDSQSGSLSLKASTNAGEFLKLDGKVQFVKDAGVGFGSLAAVGLAVGDVVFASSATEVGKAGRTNANSPIGIVMEAENANPGAQVFLHTAHGLRCTTAFGVVAGDIGKYLYLDSAGAMTLTAPIASGDYVWRLGTIVSQDGGNAVLCWAPQFIARRM